MYEKWINQLMEIALFKDIKEDELKSILNCLQPAINNYNKNDILPMKNEELTGIGIVLDGSVYIEKETFTGDKVIISRLKSGELFGEMNAFISDARILTYVAETDCTILVIPPKKIVGVCNKACASHKSLIENMLQIVVMEASILNEKMEILSLNSIRKKICAYLLQQYSMNNSLDFHITLNRNELAEYLLVPRPSISRELANMQQEGLINFHKNSFKILNLESLHKNLY